MRAVLTAFLARSDVESYLNRPRVKPILIFAALGILTSLLRTLVIAPDNGTTLPIFSVWDVLIRIFIALLWFVGTVVALRPGKHSTFESLTWLVLSCAFAFLITWADRPAAVLMILPVVARYWLDMRQAVWLLFALLVISTATYILIPPVPDLSSPEQLEGLVMLVIVTLSQGAFTYVAFELLVQNEAKQAALDAANHELNSSQAERLQAVALEERTYISRELHDTLGHELAALRLEVQRAKKLETKADAPSAAVLEALEGAMSRSSQALEQLQAVVSALRTPQLDGTLFQALQDLVGMWPEQAELTFHASEPPLTTSQMLAFYRGVQEALTNAHKHAPGQPVHIAVRQPLWELQILIRNVKVSGQESNRTLLPSGRYGLRQLSTRFAELGGEVRVEHQEKEFKVWLTLPLQK